MKRIFRRLLREPLLHFFVVGCLIFLVYLALTDAPDRPTDVIVITAERIDQLAVRHNATWNRSPTAGELDALIEDEIREEVYYRDALALGLDKNDAMVRRRLRQKMEFLSGAGATLLEPLAGELESYLASRIDTYQHASRLTFEQIYVGTSPERGAVSRLLKSLRSSTTADLTGTGERSYLPAQLELSSLVAVNSTFGAGFYEQLEKLSTGNWEGPVNSAYGVHLVRVLLIEPARTPELTEIRDRVLRDWRSEQARAVREQDYASRRERFVVEIRREQE